MNPTQTAPTDQNSSIASNPLDQIQELEQRENARADKEFSALNKEKDEVVQSITKKEEEAITGLKSDAKKDLKKHGETEVSTILMDAKNEASSECEKVEKTYASRKESAMKDLIAKATDPELLFGIAA